MSMGVRDVLTAAAIPVISSPAAKQVMAGAALVAATSYLVNKLFERGARPYDQAKNSVGSEYDAWTEDGVLETYWGEHIHLGYYTDEERAKGYKKKGFIQAKYDFIDRMMEWGGVSTSKPPASVLDVGCGIGGTSRYLAKKLGEGTQVTGISISKNQIARATQLAKERGIPNARFEVKDALAMDFKDNSFDLVWACESGEHMPDKKKYVEEMVRVLKPGGKLVIATWCQRDNSTQPFTERDRQKLDFLYSEWTHPFFISIKDYENIIKGTGVMTSVDTADWAKETIPSWRHSVWTGVWNPWPVFSRPHIWYKTIRDWVCIERMHRAFKEGLMQYGMMRATKQTAGK